MPLLTHLFLRKKSATVWLWVSFLLPGSVLLVLPAVVPLLSTLQGEILAIKPLTSSAAACWTGVSKFGSKSVVLSYACNPYWYSTKNIVILIKTLGSSPVYSWCHRYSPVLAGPWIRSFVILPRVSRECSGGAPRAGKTRRRRVNTNITVIRSIFMILERQGVGDFPGKIPACGLVVHHVTKAHDMICI